MKKLCEHFKKTLIAEFDFLTEFGFSDFEEEVIAYEYHLVTRSENDIIIDFHIEMISSTPIWITINGIGLERIFKANPFYEEYHTELDNLYKNNFDKYLESNDAKYIEKNQENFAKRGFVLNENYLKAVKSLLIKNKKYLLDKTIYDKVQEEIHQQGKLDLEEEYKAFNRLFDADHKILPDEAFLKSKFENHFLTVETDKVSVEINTFKEFKEFLNSLLETGIAYETVIYKFEPK